MTEQGPDHTPTAGETSQVEYLGDEAAPREPRPRRGRRTLVGLTVGAVVVAGAAGAFAVAQFMSGGPQAASAAPADTMAWLQVDLDPSGGQKLAAYKTLKKFPALDKHLGLTSKDDLRSWVFKGLTSDSDCKGVDFKDVDPWLGSAAGIGVRPPKADEDPVVFLSLEVTDQDKAAAGVGSLAGCLGGDKVGTAFSGDFMIVAETTAKAKAIAEAAASSALADDPTYQARTGDAGDDGIVTGYAAPSLGDFMADQMKGMGEMFGSEGGVSSGGATLAGRAGALAEDTVEPGADDPTPGTMPSDFPTDFPSDFPTDFPTDMPSGFPSDLQHGQDDFGSGMMPYNPFMFGPAGLLLGGLSGFGTGDMSGLADKLADFGGAALQVRFADESLEVEMASRGLDSEIADSGAVDLAKLPQGTGLAFGLATGRKWADTTVDRLRSSSRGQFDKEMDKASAATGLSLPEDFSTLVGDSLTFSLDSSVDLPQLFESFFLGGMSGSDGVAPAPSKIPVGVRIAGDPDRIAPLAQKLADYATREDGPAVVVGKGDDAVAIGLDQDYVDKLAKGGDLGSSTSFERALPDGGDAVAAGFADFDANGWLDKLMADSSKDDKANVAPLSGFGLTSSRDGDVMHATFRLTTD